MPYDPEVMALPVLPRGRAGALRLLALAAAAAAAIPPAIPRARLLLRDRYELWTGRRGRPLPAGPGFLAAQRAEPRVREAFAAKREAVAGYFKAAGVPFPNREIFFRVFKAEDAVELWAPPAPGAPDRLVHSWKICARSGTLGPKRAQGDGQVPEGYYELDQFNPRSNFLLSMRISYPNRGDRILGDRTDPGGLIYIHGNCVTIGCLPMTDEGIREIYLAAVEAAGAGQAVIPIHLFPLRMDEAGMAGLRARFPNDPARLAFWDDLRPGYLEFERTKRPPVVKIAEDGRYRYE